MSRPPQDQDPDTPFLLSEIKKEIESHMYRNNKTEVEHKFISEERLLEVWPSNNQRLGHFLGPGRHSADELTSVRKNYLLVLSVLIYIGISFHSIQQVFRSRFVDRGHDDSSLPFSKTLIERLFEHRPRDAEGRRVSGKWYRYERAFFENQFLFKPTEIIDTGKATLEIPTVDPLSRWPFSQPEKEIASGAFGAVYHARVVKNYLKSYPHGTLHGNLEDHDVAFKKFKKPGAGWMELENLNYLKESIDKCQRMTTHLAALIKGEHFYLFLPYTPLGVLEVFLQEGLYLLYETNTNWIRRYKFHEQFESKRAITSLDLFKELGNLAGALRFLHQRLFDDGLEIYCAHRDFRPHNILVFPGGTVGLWKISDFGISSFNSATHDQDSSKPSMGDVIRNRLSDSSRINASSAFSTPAPGPGAHRAPELSDEASSKRPTPSSDVWSLGCVASDVLAFAHGHCQPTGGAAAVNHARKSCTSLANNNTCFFEPFPQPHDRQSAAKYMVKLSILKWLSDVAKSDPEDTSRFRSCVAIIQGTLRIDPTKRVDADWVSTKLRELERKTIFDVQELRDIEDGLNAAIGPQPISSPSSNIPSRSSDSSTDESHGVASSRNSMHSNRNLEDVVGVDHISSLTPNRIPRAISENSARVPGEEDSGLNNAGATLVHSTHRNNVPSPPQDILPERQTLRPESNEASRFDPLNSPIADEDATGGLENFEQPAVSRTTTTESRRSIFSRMTGRDQSKMEKKRKVTDFTISLCGGIISSVMAAENKVQSLEVYQIENVQTQNQEVQSNVIFSRPLPELPAAAKWVEPQTAGQYVSVVGQTKGERKFAMYDRRKRPNQLLQMDLSGNSLNEVLPSSNGMFVFWGLKAVILWDSRSTAKPQCIYTYDPNEGLVSHVAFGPRGDSIYLWASEAFYIWTTVAGGTVSNQKRFKLERNLGRPERGILLPCSVPFGCLFRPKNGTWLSVRSNAIDVGPRMELPMLSAVNSSTCAADTDIFVYLSIGGKDSVEVHTIPLDSKDDSRIKLSQSGAKRIWKGDYERP